MNIYVYYLIDISLLIFAISFIGMVYFGLKDLAKTSKRGKLICTQILSSIELNGWGGNESPIHILRDFIIWEETIIFDFLRDRKISIYEGGISTEILFYRWDEFKGYKIENGYIHLIYNCPKIIRYCFCRDFYLKYDRNIENTIGGYLKKLN